MRLILVLLVSIELTFAATSSSDRIRISDLESKVSELHLQNVSQQDTNQYQMDLNYNQYNINEDLREQIKALELRLNKLEKRKK